ncbi:MAG: DUF4838 domain-containing protein [Lentisphaerae bacterium]|nr:DUF4838 domain-containing protein [Lentisphaerota bacterium]
MPILLRSPATDKLGVTDEGLSDGAYRIAYGPDWMALIGKDFNFDPPFKPWPMGRKDTAESQAAWDEAIKGHTDTGWNFPFRTGYKFRWSNISFGKMMSERYGEDNARLWETAAEFPHGFWEFDEGGSLNAVYALLRKLGVRWYMPREIGETVPEMATVTVAPIDETSHPAFAIRGWLWYNFGGFSFDDIMWSRRLGMNSGYEKIGLLRGPHGLVAVHGHKAMQEAHPEYYAVIGGEHDTIHRGHGTANFMSEGLAQETVNYIRFIFDTYDLPAVDIWPGDGIMLSQDEASRGKTASELVWGFVDRVAREVYKTHPDKLIICGAYTTYQIPPDNIDKFTPNVVVNISNCGRSNSYDPEHWARYRAMVEGWESKVAPGHLMRYENNRSGLSSPFTFPLIHPRAMARDLRYLKGKSMGERGEVAQRQMRWHAPGHDHLGLYVQARFLWDPDQDLDALLDEYYRVFYGPAAEQMQQAFEFAEEARVQKQNTTLEALLHYRDLIEAARAAAGDTLYGDRIQLIMDELKPRDEIVAEYEARQKAIAEFRDNARLAIGVDGADLSQAETYELRDISTGEEVEVKTTFRVGWDQDAILFDIKCYDPDAGNPNITSDIYSGDYVAISLETPEFSFYHIEINPEGEVIDGNPGPKVRTWKSLAEVKTERGADFWRVQARIPVVGVEEAEADPHHRVAGYKPTPEAPWYFNVGRNRMLGAREAELQTFSPTGKSNWRVPVRFGRLEIR